MTTPPVNLEDERVRETVRAILDRPEFHDVTNLPWVAETWERLKAWAEQFAHWANENPTQGWIVLGLLLLVLFGLLAHLCYVALGDVLPWGRRAGDRAKPVSTWAVLEGTAATWPQALHLARGALADGDLRRAVWIGHRVLLGLLAESGAIRFAAGKTNTDYLRECAAEHPWRETLTRLTDAYDRVVYGHQRARRDGLADLLHQVETCHETMRPEGPPCEGTGGLRR